jgi:hypothetical protein
MIIGYEIAEYFIGTASIFLRLRSFKPSKRRCAALNSRRRSIT